MAAEEHIAVTAEAVIEVDVVAAVEAVMEANIESAVRVVVEAGTEQALEATGTAEASNSDGTVLAARIVKAFRTVEAADTEWAAEQIYEQAAEQASEQVGEQTATAGCLGRRIFRSCGFVVEDLRY